MSTHSADTIFRQAVSAFKGKRSTEAQALLKQALRLEPTHADSWALMALILDNPAHKRDALQRALKSNPHHPQARQILRALEAQTPPQASRPALPPRPIPPEAPPKASLLPPPPPLPWEKAVAQEALPPARSSPPAPVAMKKKPEAAAPKKKVMAEASTGLLAGLKEELSGAVPILIGAAVVFGLLLMFLALWRNWSWGEESSAGRMRVQKEVVLEKPAWLNEAEGLRWSNQFEEAETALLEATKRPEDEALALAALALLFSDQLGGGGGGAFDGREGA
jgi:tetratricopeptide (TPR) repeat protein